MQAMEHFTLHEICDLCLVIGAQETDSTTTDVIHGAEGNADASTNNGELEDGEVLNDDQRPAKCIRLDTDFKVYNVPVNRLVISQASPVWHKMLNGSWEESTKSENALPEDYPDAMLLVLRVAHLQFQLLPKTINNDLLYQLAIVCDKYDCVELLQQWLELWTKHLKIGSINHGGIPFICWTFGLEDTFSRAMRRLTISTVYTVRIRPQQTTRRRRLAMPLIWAPSSDICIE
jgi:hypothetical protein